MTENTLSGSSISNQNKKKALHKKPWFWVLIVFAILVFLAFMSGLGWLIQQASQGDRISSSGGLFSNGSKGKDLAVVKVHGAIFNARPVIRSLEKIEKDDGIGAVLIEINSPGGAVAPSEAIYNAIRRLVKGKKKVACSMSSLAASGGYYIAAACPKIYAHKGTLTGSIGVIMQFMNTRDLYAWAKMKPVTITAGKLKDMGSPFRDMKANERILFENMLNKIHVAFKDDIWKSRKLYQKKLTEETVERFADGRIFTGEEALEIGFVDEIGDLYSAKQWLIREAKLAPDPEVYWLPKKESAWKEFLEAQTVSHSFKETIEGLKRIVRSPANLNLEPGVPYLLPEYYVNGVE